jgi:hypothetical protein
MVPTAFRLGLNTPHARTMVKTLKLAIYLVLKIWLQIWFHKYYISPYARQFLINKHKNRDKFLFTFPGSVWAWGVSFQIAAFLGEYSATVNFQLTYTWE